MTEPSKIETYTAIASLWADHFRIDGTSREKLISTYVRRCQEQRFWCVPVTSRRKGEVLCRLGHKMIYFNGRILQVVDIQQGQDGETVFDMALKPNPPAQDHARALAMAAQRHMKTQGIPPLDNFDCLTTFSKLYRNMINTELAKDLGGTVHLNPEVETRAMRFIRPRRRFYNGTGAARFKELASHLDQDILRTIRGVQCPSMSLYNWIASGDVTRRMQAIRAYPLLMPLLILSAEKFYLEGQEETVPQVKDADEEDYLKLCAAHHVVPRIISRAAEAIGQKVDAGERLLPIIAEAFNAPENVIRQISRSPVHHTGSALRHVGRNGWTRMIDTYALAAMLGNRRPTTKKAWANWLQFYAAIPWRLCDDIPVSEWPAFLAGMPAFDDPRWDDLTRKTKDLRDLALTRWKDGPIKGWPLSRLHNLSEKWHEERARVVLLLQQEDERNAVADDACWTPLLPAPYHWNKLTIVELNTPDKLSDEASRLSHCVDGYSTYCYDGRSRILSIRDGDTSLATMELCLKPFKKVPKVSNLHCAQLRGFNNKGFDPKSPVTAIANKLLSQIRSGAIKVNLQWPNVPNNQRPARMRRRDERVSTYMSNWLESELGLTRRPQRQMAPAA